MNWRLKILNFNDNPDPLAVRATGRLTRSRTIDHRSPIGDGLSLQVAAAHKINEPDAGFPAARLAPLDTECLTGRFVTSGNRTGVVTVTLAISYCDAISILTFFIVFNELTVCCALAQVFSPG